MPGAILQEPSLPIFDFSKFLHGSSGERKKTAIQVVDAFKTFGFVYLTNHGITNQETDDLFNWSRKVFSLPHAVKQSPEMIRPEPGPDSLIVRGFSEIGREKLSQNVYDDDGLKSLRAVPDAKEMFEMGPPTGPGEVREPNRFPSEDQLPGFEPWMKTFYWNAQSLGMEILRSIAVGLDLDEEYFVKYHEDADNGFRLIRYPPVERAQIRAGTTALTTPHTDFGTITILFQDDVGGLEVENPAKPGTYLSATPIPGAVVVNIGDFLMRWTNDILKSNLHRVVEPPAERDLPDGMEMTKERFSIPFFIQADRLKIVKCAEGLEGDGAKYPPISPGEYIYKRISATFKTF